MIEKAPMLENVPFLYASALTGQRVPQLLDLILEVADARQIGCPPPRSIACCRQLLERSAPPQKPGEEVKLLYA